MNTVEEIANVIKHIKSAVIFTHLRPDGDTLGSALALSRALSLLKIANQTVNEGEIPEEFFFLEAAKRILRALTLDAEAYICVDSSDETRLGQLQSVYFAGAKKKITVNIDHHVSNTRYAKYNFVRHRASNCENVADVIKAMGVPFDKEIADCLMTGAVTDSGAFSHDDVSGDTFRAAADFADAGANVAVITYELFKKRSKARAALYAETVASLRYLLNDTFAVAVVPRERLERLGLKQDATEGVVDFGLTVDCVEVSASLLEMKKGQYKVSLRSKGKVNVNRVAATFGGGGHVLASGCMLFGELEDVIDRLRYAVLQHSEG